MLRMADCDAPDPTERGEIDASGDAPRHERGRSVAAAVGLRVMNGRRVVTGATCKGFSLIKQGLAEAVPSSEGVDGERLAGLEVELAIDAVSAAVVVCTDSS